MKKFAPFILIGVIVLVLVGGVAAFAVKKSMGGNAKPTPTPTKKKITKPVNVIPFEERPYVVMAPTTGREVDVTVKVMPKAADSVDYLAEYQYGTSLGGNEQFIDLKKGLPAVKQFALYSRSAGGKTSYEEDVKGGTLTMNFSGGNEYAVKQDWKYIDNKEKLTEFTMDEDKFTVSSPDLKNVRYAILYNAPGAPKAVTGKRLSEVYTFQGTSSLTGKTLDISIMTTEAGTGTIYGWTGSEWKSFTTTMDGNKASAKVDALEAYVVAE